MRKEDWILAIICAGTEVSAKDAEMQNLAFQLIGIYHEAGQDEKIKCLEEMYSKINGPIDQMIAMRQKLADEIETIKAKDGK